MKLLVIDIQKGITDSRLFNFEAFIDDTIRIIKAARDNQVWVKIPVYGKINSKKAGGLFIY